MTNGPTARTLGALIEELAIIVPDRPALTFKDRTLTFAEVRSEVRLAARALIAAGIRPGDQVGLLLANSVEWIVLNFAIQYIGGTMVALNSWYTRHELDYVIDHADVTHLLMANRILKTDYTAMFDGESILEVYPKLTTAILFGSGSIKDTQAWPEVLKGAPSVSEETVLGLLDEVQPDGIAYQLYTSGSTARPKGVMLTHRHLLDNCYEIGTRMHFGPDDVIYMPLSLFWGMGCMNMLLGPWNHHAHIVLQEQFNPDEGLEIIHRHRATVLAGTPNIIHAIFNHPRAGDYDLSSVRKGTPLGTPDISREIIESVMAEGVHCYGLTETHGFATVNDGNDPIDKRCTTEGRAMPGWQIRIADPETGEEVPAGTTGEVRLKGRLMAGYYRNPESTAAAYDSDGWFMTGDMGYLDPEGYLHFRGRFKEMLKTGGINVAPAEVEEMLMTHPDIEQAYVTGIPDDVQGEVVAAAVIPKRGRTLDADDVQAFCRPLMARYKQPRQVQVISLAELPLTRTQKVHRLRLPSLFTTAPAVAEPTK